MPYATLDDVQRRMPQFQLTPTSKPANDAAQVFLDDTHAQMDAKASCGSCHDGKKAFATTDVERCDGCHRGEEARP